MAAPDGLFDVESADPYVAACVKILASAPGWLRTPGRDEELVTELIRLYPDLKLQVELGRWVHWMTQRSMKVDEKGGVLRVRNWFRRGRVFRLESRRDSQDRGRARAREVRSGAGPSSPEAFRSEARPGIVPW